MNEWASEKKRPTQHWERKCWQKMADRNKCFIGYTEKIIKNRLTHTWSGYKLPWYMALSSVCCKLEHSHWAGIGGKLNFWILSWKIPSGGPIQFQVTCPVSGALTDEGVIESITSSEHWRISGVGCFTPVSPMREWGWKWPFVAEILAYPDLQIHILVHPVHVSLW